MDKAWAPPVEAPGEERSRTYGAALALWTLGVAILSALILALYAPLFEPGRLHVHGAYLDQVGYITTARILVDTGELRNGVLFPSQIDNPRFRAYMPGHFYALAASYALFGYGVFQTLLPSLAAYVLATALVFLIANRLYGRFSGLFAALLFALHPTYVAYAFTAMAELTFTLAAVAAFAAFVHLPRRLWPFAPPVLLVLPFLFRESGAFLVIPMALLVLRGRGLLPALLSCAGSVASLYAVNRWQIATGKLEASLTWVTRGGFNYYYGYSNPEPELSLGAWLAAVWKNLGRNAAILAEHFRELPGELVPIGLFAILAAGLLVLVIGVLRRRRDPFPLGAGLLFALVIALTVTLYDARGHKLMRMTLFAYPLVAVAIAGVFRPEPLVRRMAVARPSARALRLAGLCAALGLTALGSHAVAALAGRQMTLQDEIVDRSSAAIAELHDEKTVIVCPLNLAPSYPVDQYPVVWCMPIGDTLTYHEIRKRYRIGTILSLEPYPQRFLKQARLRLRTELTWENARAYLYELDEAQ